MVPFERLIVSYSLSVANMDVSLAVSTQYTNVTAGHCTTACRPRLCSIAFLEGSHDGAEMTSAGSSARSMFEEPQRQIAIANCSKSCAMNNQCLSRHWS